MPTYDEVVTESLSIGSWTPFVYTELLTGSVTIIDPNTDGMRAFPRTLADTVNVTSPVDLLPLLARVCTDLVTLTDARAAQFIGQHIAAEGLGVGDSLSTGQYGNLSDSVTNTATLDVQRGVLLFEQLGLTEAMLAASIRNINVADTMRLMDSLAQFFGADLYEVIGVVDTALRVKMHALTTADAMTLTDTAARGLLLRVVANEDMDFTAAMALDALYFPHLRENIEISVLYFGPGDGFTTWVMNTASGAMSEYENYRFNSFAAMGNKYLAASENGLYELNGDNDQGASIIGAIKSGWIEMGGSRYTSFKAAYLGVRGAGEMFLKLVTGDGKEYLYKTSAKDMETTKVHFGKGLRSRYFAFELYNVGQDFDLNSIEFLPIINQRRT